MLQPVIQCRTSIREMQPSDIPAVSERAARIWRAHYPGIISHAQIEYMLERMYSTESLRQQVGKNHRFWLIETDGELAGYLSAEDEGGGKWFLHKLYIDASLPKQGLGSQLMWRLMDTVGPKELTLAVNRANVRAINFYFKHGFVIDRLQATDIGNGFVMDDFIMKRSL